MILDAEKPIAQRCRAHKIKDAWVNDQQPSKGYKYHPDFDRESEAGFMRDSVWAWGITSN